MNSSASSSRASTPAHQEDFHASCQRKREIELELKTYTDSIDHCQAYLKNKYELAKDIVNAFPVLKGSVGEGFVKKDQGDNSLLHHKAGHDAYVRDVIDENISTAICGVKSDCPFNELGYRNVTNNLVVDAMHDLLEDWKNKDADTLSRNPVEGETETSDKFPAIPTRRSLAILVGNLEERPNPLENKPLKNLPNHR
ncbi:hypothetical protein NPIL_339771 [Nephila pilipes]|uniref:Uncharacterized protein n=1 Tax=Nephila pilipes TaxID=299642 RepID=A0A8X6IZU8_NEPPI|nr:hypothetical protein NPIL_339771 [Nephila pilipes]